MTWKIKKLDKSTTEMFISKLKKKECNVRNIQNWRCVKSKFQKIS